MKLYATINSETIKKIGKSGNDFLEIIVKGERRKNILEIKIETKKEHYLITGYAISTIKEDRKAEQYFSYEIPIPKIQS